MYGPCSCGVMTHMYVNNTHLHQIHPSADTAPCYNTRYVDILDFFLVESNIGVQIFAIISSPSKLCME